MDNIYIVDKKLLQYAKEVDLNFKDIYFEFRTMDMEKVVRRKVFETIFIIAIIKKMDKQWDSKFKDKGFSQSFIDWYQNLSEDYFSEKIILLSED